MNFFEKTYSVLAILFAFGLLTSLVLFPQLRVFDNLLLVCLLGFIINIGLMFVVLRDIFLRQFNDQKTKYFWLILVLLLWPSIIVYLLKHGFQPRF